MGLHGGKYARVNGIDTMRQWTIQESERQPKAVASNTLLGTARRRGVRAWSGTYQAYGAKPVTGIMPGNVFAFEGYGAPNNDLAGGAGLLYSGDAMVNSVAISWNWKGGEIIAHTVTFSGIMELIKEDGADPGDDVPPVLPEVGGTRLEYAMYDSASYARLPNLTNMTLTLSAIVHDYVNADTYVEPHMWTGRVSGPIDWTLSAGQEDVNRLAAGGMFDAGDFVNLRAYTSATEFWQLKYGIARDFTGITVSRETGAVIARTLNFDMNAYYGSTAGEIKLPGGTQWWPF